MKKILIASVSFLIVFSIGCKKQSQPDEVNISVSMYISVKNSEGADLLNPGTPGAINKEDIDIFYLKDGVKQRVFNGNYDLPKNFDIVKYDNGNYSIKLFLSDYQNSNNISSTYIEFKDKGTDTITAEVVKKPGTTYLTRIWYNGNQLDWEAGYPEIEIIK